MSSDSLRGSRLGTQSQERTTGIHYSPRQTVKYVCPKGHESEMLFSIDAEIPHTWQCKSCPATAVTDAVPVPDEVIGHVTKTHLDQLLERRTRDELEEILAEAIADLRKRRAAAEKAS